MRTLYMKVTQDREHSYVPPPQSAGRKANKMSVACTPATRKTFALPNARISSRHCSLSISSCPRDGWTVLMPRSFTRKWKGESWLQICSMEDNCQSNCPHDIRNSMGRLAG